VLQALDLSSKGAAARRSAANAGSVMLPADGGGSTQTCPVYLGFSLINILSFFLISVVGVMLFCSAAICRFVRWFNQFSSSSSLLLLFHLTWKTIKRRVVVIGISTCARFRRAFQLQAACTEL